AAVGRARLCLTRPRGGAGGAAARNRGGQSRSRAVPPVPRRDPEPEPARRRALPARRPGVRAAPRAVARRPGARETGGGDGSGSGRRSRRSDPPIGICVRAGGAERVPAPVSLLRRNAPRGAEGELLPPVRPAAVGRAALSRVWQRSGRRLALLRRLRARDGLRMTVGPSD